MGGHVVHHLEADAVAQTHLEESLGQTAIAHRGSSGHHAIFHHLLNFLVVGLQGEEVGAAGLGIDDGPYQHHRALRLLEFGGHHLVCLADGRGEGDQRGRHIQLLEGAGHAVLTADGGDAEADLCVQCAQQSGQRLAPALRGSAKALEVLLEGQVGVLIAEAGGHQLGHTLDDGHPCAHILVGAHEVGVVAPCHAGAGAGLAVHRQLCHHGVLRGELVGTAEGHEHGSSTDGGVEPLRKALLAADVQIAHHILHLLFEGHAGPLGLPDSPLLDVDVLVLGGRLEDMDSIQFLPRIRGLARKPLVLLRDDGRNEKSAVESLSQEDACYLIRQATLEDMLQELRVPAHRPAESLEKRCERIYRSWGLSTYDANKRYLTGALRMMMGSDHRLAIRKEILGPVAEEYNLTVAAVDSALRRLLETLDETGTQTWRDFRKEYGLERRKVTIGRLLYALESKLSQQ